MFLLIPVIYLFLKQKKKRIIKENIPFAASIYAGRQYHRLNNIMIIIYISARVKYEMLMTFKSCMEAIAIWFIVFVYSDGRSVCLSVLQPSERMNTKLAFSLTDLDVAFFFIKTNESLGNDFLLSVVILKMKCQFNRTNFVEKKWIYQ